MLCPGCPVSFVHLVKAFLVVAQYCDRLRFAVSIGLDVVVYLNAVLYLRCDYSLRIRYENGRNAARASIDHGGRTRRA